MTIEEYNYFVKKLKVIGYNRLKTVITDNVGKHSILNMDRIMDIYCKDNTVILFNVNKDEIEVREFSGEAIRPTIEQTKLVNIVRNLDRITLSFLKSERVTFGTVLFTIVIYPNSGIWSSGLMYSCFDSNDANKKYLYSTSTNAMYIMHNNGVPCIKCMTSGRISHKRFLFIPADNPDKVVYYFEFEHDLKRLNSVDIMAYADAKLNIEKREIWLKLDSVDNTNVAYLCKFRLHTGKLDDNTEWLSYGNVYLEKIR